MVELAFTDTPADMVQIISLQKLNHISAVEAGLWATEGFVTLAFDAETLDIMRGSYRHVIAKEGDKVVGYALVLLREKSSYFPFLDTMFQQIDTAVFKGRPVNQQQYFVMGQICVDNAFRGQGIFRALYNKLREQMQAKFDFVATEVSMKNIRSVIAHRKIGFRDINDTKQGHPGEWEVIAWDWN